MNTMDTTTISRFNQLFGQPVSFCYLPAAVARYTEKFTWVPVNVTGGRVALSGGHVMDHIHFLGSKEF